MRIFLLSFFIAALFSTISAQTHERALEEFAGLKQKVEDIKKESAEIEKIILQPDRQDLAAGAQENARVFRILPREKYDKDVFKVRGGGAYYSFTNESHNYDLIPQISLEQNYLQVGFYGASYGFLTDLGELQLAKIDEKTKGVNLLANYQPPLELPKARIEQQKARGFEAENVAYKNRLPAIIGHSYVVRAISYNEADVLVAFKIYRQDADGSLIIFWKLLENFEKPTLIRDKQTASNNKTDFVSVNYSGAEAARIEEILRKKGFVEVKVSEENKLIVLRGKVPKGKMVKVIELVLEITGKPVRNELTEK